MRGKYALLLHSSDYENSVGAATRDADLPQGFAAILLSSEEHERAEVALTVSHARDVVLLPKDFDYLAEGDILRVNPMSGNVATVFRKATPNNSILLTEQCNHLCLMCSQPPKAVDDSWLLDEAFDLIRLIPTDTPNIGFTGGEPTTYGNKFIELIEATKRNLPRTSVDVLTNGRAFKDEQYASSLGRIKHPDLQLGIPLYSDDPVRHDFIVQSKGAFDETIHGILNLKRHGVRVEIRVVVHQQTLPRLIETCEFIARNLLFVDHVALMGLEITGFTRANLDILWADPYDYRDILSEAINVLRTYGMHCSVYNHQLCLVNEDVSDVCRKSISDWKNEYLPQCDRCAKKSECGGFFSTQVMYRHSDHINPLRT
jgi:His-Xaa-Ser system radical SAM maturase HxsC